jgi:hypothetical protein
MFLCNCEVLNRFFQVDCVVCGLSVDAKFGMESQLFTAKKTHSILEVKNPTINVM